MRKFLLSFSLVVCFYFSNSQTVKIPIDGTRWYQLNNTNTTLARLFDNEKNTVPSLGWNLMLSPYEAYYPLLEGEEMIIDSLRMYDKEGIFTNNPVKIFAINGQWERILIGTFVGEAYNKWVGPYPANQNVFKLDTAISGIKYLMLQIYGNGLPGELEFYGAYTTPSSFPGLKANPPRESLKSMFGINGFAWNILEGGVAPRTINEQKMNAVKSFRGFRQYIDWQKCEPVEGRYYFSPQEGGGWALDTVYTRLKEEGIEVLATFQNIPTWLVNTYPDHLREIDNNPVSYGKSLTDPLSYIEQAKLGFQYAARYGKNKDLDPTLVNVYTIPAWPNQVVNVLKIGLGLINYMECGNEVDKTWKGRKGYLSGREYAANLSAFYDGHKNTMGPNVGVKNADPFMKVVMSGVAFPTTDYFRGIIDWCKEFRGYKPDGQVDLCFDVINYHYYSSDRGMLQTSNGTRGVAPELSLSDSIARNFIQDAHLYANDMPVWISEHGYDINQGSILRAFPIGNRSALETQADWSLRSALLYSREGLQKSFFYQMFDLNVASSTKYASMGLIDLATLKRKPASDFFYQTIKLFGEYIYEETLNRDPFVDRYQWNDQVMYALVVPDEKGRTSDYILDLNGADSAIIYTPTAGADDMIAVKTVTNAGKLLITVTETPSFVVPFSFSADSTMQTANLLMQNKSEALSYVQSKKNAPDARINIHPNPATDQLFIHIADNSRHKVFITDMRGNKVVESQLLAGGGSVNISRLAAGVYVLNLTEAGSQKVISRMIVKQ